MSSNFHLPREREFIAFTETCILFLGEINPKIVVVNKLKIIYSHETEGKNANCQLSTPSSAGW